MKKMILSVIAFAFTLILCYSQLPSGFNAVQVQDGYFVASGTIFSDDGSKMFVWNTFGRIDVSIWNGSSYIKQPTPVLDISEEVGGWRDFGLQSICLDPNFDTNGFIYLFYNVDRHHLLYYGTSDYDPNADLYWDASNTRLTRYTLNVGSTITADMNSRFVMLGESINNTGPVIMHQSHGGGTVIFGNDGSLLVSTGDGSSYSSADVGSDGNTYWQQALADGLIRPEENVGSFRCQMLNSFSGKILRLDPATGDGLPSNPFYDAANPRSAESRMYAMGLRNPFRMTVLNGSGSTNIADGNPGLLFVSDVGWATWEDLHVIDQPGLNAGWPLFEGQTHQNEYLNTGTVNLDEGGVTFQSLLSEPTSHAVDPVVTNRRFTHSRPAFAYHHFGSSEVRVPWFNGTTPIDPRITDAGSPTTGVEFQGNAITGGLFYTSGRYGPAYQNKFFFTDYTSNFIRVADFNPNGAPWFTSIQEFAPDNTGNLITHLSFNPIDEFIYYTNNNGGTIFKITADETLAIAETSVSELKIYPNPAKDIITIEGITGKTEIKIFDLNGRVVKTTLINQNSHIPLKLSSGLYVLQITSEGEMQTKKLIIE